MVVFPKPFQHYRPLSQKVYGVICVSERDRFLLVRGRRTGIWSFPKGHLKPGEMAHDCALRETREETGLALEPWAFYATRKLFAGEYYLYRVLERPLCPEDDGEVDEAGWFSLADMLRMEVNADVRRFLGTTHKIDSGPRRSVRQRSNHGNQEVQHQAGNAYARGCAEGQGPLVGLGGRANDDLCAHG